MKESDYILCASLVRVRCALSEMRDIITFDGGDESLLKDSIIALTKLEESLFGKVVIDA